MRQGGQEAVLGGVGLGEALVGPRQLGGAAPHALLQLVVQLAQAAVVLGGQQARLAVLDGAGDGLLEVLDDARLDEVVVGAAAHGRDGRLDGGVAGQQHAHRRRPARPHLAEQVHLADGQLGQQHVGRVAGVVAQGRASVSAVSTSCPSWRSSDETVAQHLRLAVHDQHARGPLRHVPPLLGTMMHVRGAAP